MKTKWILLLLMVLAGYVAWSAASLLHKNQRIEELETELADMGSRRTIRAEKSKPADTPESSSKPQKSGERWLYEAAGRGDVATLKKMLDERPDFLNATPGNNHASILHNAAGSGQPGAVEELLRRKANINAQNDPGFTPLHDAINRDTPGRVAVVELLLKSGADHSIRNKAGQTPLALALAKEQKQIADLLRKYGAKE